VQCKLIRGSLSPAPHTVCPQKFRVPFSRFARLVGIPSTQPDCLTTETAASVKIRRISSKHAMWSDNGLDLIMLAHFREVA